ncbi:MAG: pseudouridine synthase [Bacteroidota bacterium]
MSTLVVRNQIKPTQIRLNKFLASAGVTSRRKSDELIAAGRVRVNLHVVRDMGIRIDPRRDAVSVDGRQVTQVDEPVYIVLHKPKDCITTAQDEKGRRTVMDYVRVQTRVFPVGRLDRNTTGVLLLTNDGEFAHRLMHPKFEIAKAYEVTLVGSISEEDLKKLSDGVRLEDGWTVPCDVFLLPGGKEKKVGIILHEGRTHQVMRMFKALGYEVRHLHRAAYGNVSVEGLARGGWRFLTKAEVTQLKKTVSVS